jgi:hypothetical protein
MDIASTLQRLSLEVTTQSRFHVLFMQYPVTDLLPADRGIGLRMEPPRAALHREKPDLDKYMLREHGLEFYIRLPVTTAQSSSLKSSLHMDLGTAITRLSRGGGRSILDAVTVSDNDYDERGYIFRLTTLWHDSGHQDIHTFQVNETEWKNLLSMHDQRSWTSLLLDLFSRSSDRAYLHVERQLQGSEYCPIDALKWNFYDILTANRLLAINMREVRSQGTLFCLLPIRNFYGDSERVFVVRLPCEHECEVSIAFLKSLSLASCIDMACSTCGQIVLPDRDILHAQHSTERLRRQRKALDEVLWKRVEAGSTDRSARIVTSGAIICQGLAHALHSMHVPESVSPRQVCPANSLEAAAILDQLRKTYGHLSDVFSTTLKDLHSHLLRTVDVVLRETIGLINADISHHIFPGWSPFIRRWLERTMALVEKPGYAGEDVWELFGEVPDDDICFSEEEEILGGDVDIGKLMNEVSLL